MLRQFFALKTGNKTNSENRVHRSDDEITIWSAWYFEDVRFVYHVSWRERMTFVHLVQADPKENLFFWMSRVLKE